MTDTDTSPPTSTHWGDTWIALGLCTILLLVISSTSLLWQYKTSPGPSGNAPIYWPTESRIGRGQAIPTLVMFAHPMCPCTRASLSELRVLMSEFKGRIDAYVLFALPTGVGDSWAKSGAWGTAASIPGVQVQRDAGESEAKLFGAKTSGQVVLYGKTGEILFQGGITGARGHAGDNEGRSRLVSLLREHSTTPVGSPVFGCPLEDPK